MQGRNPLPVIPAKAGIHRAPTVIPHWHSAPTVISAKAGIHCARATRHSMRVPRRHLREGGNPLGPCHSREGGNPPRQCDETSIMRGMGILAPVLSGGPQWESVSTKAGLLAVIPAKAGIHCAKAAKHHDGMGTFASVFSGGPQSKSVFHKGGTPRCHSREGGNPLCQGNQTS